MDSAGAGSLSHGAVSAVATAWKLGVGSWWPSTSSHCRVRRMCWPRRSGAVRSTRWAAATANGSPISREGLLALVAADELEDRGQVVRDRGLPPHRRDHLEGEVRPEAGAVAVQVAEVRVRDGLAQPDEPT